MEQLTIVIAAPRLETAPHKQLVRLGSRYYLPKQLVEALDSGDLVLLSIMKGAGDGS